MRTCAPLIRVHRQAVSRRAVVVTIESKIVGEDESLTWLNWAGYFVADVFSYEHKDLDGRHFSVSNRLG